jgi:hypothetical protein
VSADEPVVGATWKLRAIVYGSLLVIGALVLVARPGDSSSSEPHLRILRGRTAQGKEVRIGMSGGRIRNVRVPEIKPPCGPRAGWYPVVGLKGVEYHQTGNRIDLYQRWSDAIAAFHGRVSQGGGEVEGTIYFTWLRCNRSEPVSYKASG